MNIRVAPFRTSATLHARLRHHRPLFKRRTGPSLLHAYRIPITVVVLSVGAYTYVSYKIQVLELCNKVSAIPGDLVKSASVTLPEIKLPDVGKLIEDLLVDKSTGANNAKLEGTPNTPDISPPTNTVPELHKTVAEALSSIQKGADGVIKLVSAGASTVELPKIETPQFLRDLFPPGESAPRDHGSSFADSGNLNTKPSGKSA